MPTIALYKIVKLIYMYTRIYMFSTRYKIFIYWFYVLLDACNGAVDAAADAVADVGIYTCSCI